jgi:hypothetical protein
MLSVVIGTVAVAIFGNSPCAEFLLNLYLGPVVTVLLFDGWKQERFGPIFVLDALGRVSVANREGIWPRAA